MKETSSRAKVIVGVLAASATLASFNCLMPLLAEIQASFPEQSVSRVQMVYTLISLVAVPVMLLSGSATRVLSKKTLISIGLIALLIGGVLPVFVHGAFWVLYLSSLLIGAGTGAMNVISSALISDHFHGIDKGRVMGLQSIALSLAAALLSMLSGEIAKVSHWSRSYLLFLIAAPILVVFLCFMPADERTPVQPPARQVYNRSLLVMVALTFFWNLLYTSFQTNVAMFIAETGYGDTAFSGLVSAVFMLVGIPCGLFIGAMIKLMRSRILAVSVLVAGAGMLCTAFSAGPALVLIGSLLVGAAFGTYGPAAITAAATMVPTESAAAGIAIANSFGQLGRFLSPHALNALSGVFGGGFRMVFLVGGVGLLILGVVYLILNPVRDEDLL